MSLICCSRLHPFAEWAQCLYLLQRRRQDFSSVVPDLNRASKSKRDNNSKRQPPAARVESS